MRLITPAVAALALSLFVGCATTDDINAAMTDDLRHTGGAIGFALDADLEALNLRLAVLKAFQGDPKLPKLEAELGTIADVEAKLERVRASKRAILDENKKLRDRYRPAAEQ